MIYLDNAATTFPKPAIVTDEVMHCITAYCGNAGRGAHALALTSATKIYECREALAAFFGLQAPECIVFCSNTTHALNLALRGLIKPHSHVLLSELDHNATRRPICALEKEQGVKYDLFPVLGYSTEEILQGISARIRPETVAVVCTHASNVCSVTLPVCEIGAFCHARGLFFILDAAQSAGHVPIDMSTMHVSALAAPSHKGLMGIQGAGILALGEDVMPLPLLYGGSGVDSLSPDMPQWLPERLEAGTLPTPAIASLHAALSYLDERGIEEIAKEERALFLAARERLESLDGIRVLAREWPGAVLSFVRAGYDSTEIATTLAARGICVRAGLHCAPLAHRALGTLPGGAVRLSFGPFNTLADIDAVWHALQ